MHFFFCGILYGWLAFLHVTDAKGASSLRGPPAPSILQSAEASQAMRSALSIAHGSVPPADIGGVDGFGPPPPPPVHELAAEHLPAQAKRLRPLRRPTTKEMSTMLLEGSSERGFNDVQPTCDKIAGLVKDKNKAEESKCDSVILGGVGSWGCKCVSIGENQGDCAFKEEGYSPGKEVSDLGITRVMTEANFGDGLAGSMKGLTCMYYMFPGDLFQRYPDRTQANLKAMNEEATGVLKNGNAAAYNGAKGVFYGMFVLTPPPWPVDKYGTPMCFGLCTTLNVPYWMQWTQTPEPKL